MSAFGNLDLLSAILAGQRAASDRRRTEIMERADERAAKRDDLAARIMQTQLGAAQRTDAQAEEKAAATERTSVLDDLAAHPHRAGAFTSQIGPGQFSGISPLDVIRHRRAKEAAAARDAEDRALLLGEKRAGIAKDFAAAEKSMRPGDTATTLAKEVAALYQHPQTGAGIAEAMKKPEARALFRQLLLDKVKRGDINVSLGTGDKVPVGKKTINDAEAAIVGQTHALRLAKKASAMLERDIVGAGGTIGGAVAHAADWLNMATPEQLEMLDKKQRLKSIMGMAVQRLARTIERGRMSNEDREFYMELGGNPQKASFQELVTSLRFLEETASEDLAFNLDVLETRGFDTGKLRALMGPQGRAQEQAASPAQAPQQTQQRLPLADPDVQAAIESLKAGGMTEQEAIKHLEGELFGG